MKRTILVIGIISTLAGVTHAQTAISALPAGTPVVTDIMPFVALGSPNVTKKTTVTNLFGLITPARVASANINGNGTKFQLFTGSFATNDCAKFDASGNLVTNGGTCAAAAPVQTVFGRTGAVVAAPGDYTAAQVTNAAATNASNTFTASQTVQAAQPDLTLNYTNTANYARLLFNENGTAAGALQFIGSTFATTARRNGMEFYNSALGDVVFFTGNPTVAERLRVRASGVVDVAGGGALHLTGASAPTYPTSGDGLEIVYDSDGTVGASAGGSGVVNFQAYARDSSAWRDLWLQGARLGLGQNPIAFKQIRHGSCTLSAGTCTVSDTTVTTSSRIYLTAQDNSSVGVLRISARTASTSFTITSSNAGDSGVVAWELIEP